MPSIKYFKLTLLVKYHFLVDLLLKREEILISYFRNSCVFYILCIFCSMYSSVGSFEHIAVSGFYLTDEILTKL